MAHSQSRINPWEGPNGRTIESKATELLHLYIYDYFKKKKFNQAARAFSSEANVATDQTPPFDIATGFLGDWWNIFWDMYYAKSKEAEASKEALIYDEYHNFLRAKRDEVLNQQRNFNMHQAHQRRISEAQAQALAHQQQQQQQQSPRMSTHQPQQRNHEPQQTPRMARQSVPSQQQQAVMSRDTRPSPAKSTVSLPNNATTNNMPPPHMTATNVGNNNVDNTPHSMPANLPQSNTVTNIPGRHTTASPSFSPQQMAAMQQQQQQQRGSVVEMMQSSQQNENEPAAASMMNSPMVTHQHRQPQGSGGQPQNQQLTAIQHQKMLQYQQHQNLINAAMNACGFAGRDYNTLTNEEKMAVQQQYARFSSRMNQQMAMRNAAANNNSAMMAAAQSNPQIQARMQMQQQFLAQQQAQHHHHQQQQQAALVQAQQQAQAQAQLHQQQQQAQQQQHPSPQMTQGTPHSQAHSLPPPQPTPQQQHHSLPPSTPQQQQMQLAANQQAQQHMSPHVSEAALQQQRPIGPTGPTVNGQTRPPMMGPNGQMMNQNMQSPQLVNGMPFNGDMNYMLQQQMKQNPQLQQQYYQQKQRMMMNQRMVQQQQQQMQQQAQAQAQQQPQATPQQQPQQLSSQNSAVNTPPNHNVGNNNNNGSSSPNPTVASNSNLSPEDEKKKAAAVAMYARHQISHTINQAQQAQRQAQQQQQQQQSLHQPAQKRQRIANGEEQTQSQPPSSPSLHHKLAGGNGSPHPSSQPQQPSSPQTARHQPSQQQSQAKQSPSNNNNTNVNDPAGMVAAATAAAQVSQSQPSQMIVASTPASQQQSAAVPSFDLERFMMTGAGDFSDMFATGDDMTDPNLLAMTDMVGADLTGGGNGVGAAGMMDPFGSSGFLSSMGGPGATGFDLMDTTGMSNNGNSGLGGSNNVMGTQAMSSSNQMQSMTPSLSHQSTSLLQPVSELAGHANKVSTVSFSFDGQWLASAGHDKKVMIWNVQQQQHQDKKASIAMFNLDGHTSNITCARWSPDTRYYVATSSYDKTLRIWDVGSVISGNDVKVKKEDGATEDDKIDIDKDGNDDKKTKMESPKQLVKFDCRAQVTAVDFAPNKPDTICSLDAEGELKVWNISTSSCEKSIKMSQSKSGFSPNPMRFHPRSASILACAVGNQIYIIDIMTAKNNSSSSSNNNSNAGQMDMTGIRTIQTDHGKNICSFDWSADGHFLVASSEDKICVYETSHYKCVMHHIPQSKISGCAFVNTGSSSNTNPTSSTSTAVNSGGSSSSSYHHQNEKLKILYGGYQDIFLWQCGILGAQPKKAGSQSGMVVNIACCPNPINTTTSSSSTSSTIMVATASHQKEKNLMLWTI